MSITLTSRCVVAGILLSSCLSSAITADPPANQLARVAPFHGYAKSIEMTRGDARVVLCPEVGGRVLEFSVNGQNAMYLDDGDKNWQPGKPPSSSAGRFDYGPELTVIPHPNLWSGEWTGEITGKYAAKLTSPKDAAAGIQLVRDFLLSGGDNDKPPYHLVCKQTIHNVSNEVREVCHWGRSFSPGGGICVIPLGDRPSRFPAKYAMYEDSAIINVRNTDDKIRERNGFLEILAPPRKPKLGFDTTAGWLAYLTPNNMLFVKRFKTYPDRVYNEAAGLTLSVWCPKGPQIELEPIGPRERLQPGESASFTEDWWLLPFPFPKDGQQVDLKALDSLIKTTILVSSTTSNLNETQNPAPRMPTTRIGAVAYSPSAVAIFDGLTRYLNKHDFPSDYVLYSNYDSLIAALDKGEVDIAWNTPLAHAKYHVQHQCSSQTLVMPDVDFGVRAILIARADAKVTSLSDLAGKKLILGSNQAAEATVLPLYFLKKDGQDLSNVQIVSLDAEVDSQGNPCASPHDVLKALLEGRGDAGIITNELWAQVKSKSGQIASLQPIWTSPPFSHCVFTASATFDKHRGARFTKLMEAMDPNDRSTVNVMRLEGTKKWLAGSPDGFQELVKALQDK